MIVAASIMQVCAALLAIMRALFVPFLPRLGALAGIVWPAASSESKRAAWYLAAVLSLDVVGENVNIVISAHLPPPNGAPLTGVERIAAHAGLAFYSAWVCCILVFAAWLARKTMIGAFVHHAAFGAWAAVALAFVAAYPDLRGDASLRVLGALHVLAFVAALPCLATFARSRGERILGTERICALWLVFLSLAAGLGPLQPWANAPIDRDAAERVTSTSMLVLYVSIVLTIILGGAKWVRSFLSVLYGSRRSRLSS